MTTATKTEVKVGDTMYLSPYHDMKLPDKTPVSIPVSVTKVTPTRITTSDGSSWTVRVRYSGLAADSFRKHGSGDSWYGDYLRRTTEYKVMTLKEYQAEWAIHNNAVKADADAELRKLIDDYGLETAMITVLTESRAWSRGELRKLKDVLTEAEAATWDKALEDALVTAVGKLVDIRQSVRSISASIDRIK